ncbi:MAG: FMN-binding protein, partial [Pirellulaceae bacterium]
PRLPLAAVKLLGDMGQTDRALKFAEAFARQGSLQEAYLLAGDACRLAGKYPQATGYYQKVIDAPDARNEEYTRRYRNRAAESLQAMQLFDQADASKLADGTYRAASEGYNGQIEVEVAVREGRISDVRVTQHQEKQFYSALTDTTQQIIQKQSVKNIDATSRATITSQAIVNATAKALAGGTR